MQFAEAFKVWLVDTISQLRAHNNLQSRANLGRHGHLYCEIYWWKLGSYSISEKYEYENNKTNSVES